MTGGWLALAAVASLAGGAASATDLSFERAFAVAGEPATVHFAATYGTGHRLEVWRDHDRRVKRVTDGAVETYAAHRPGDADFTMSVVDRHKRIVTDIDRTNLYRLGNFTDWFDLTHGLRHPKGVHRLTAGSPPAGAPKPLARCDWFDLVEGPRTTRICWSRADRLPLLIVAATGQPLWTVTAIDHAPLAAGVFSIDAKGFVRIDAKRDIEAD